MSMGGHQSAAMKSDVWLTPPEIVRALGAFDLDPCSPADRPWDTARQHYSIENDGLRQQWAGRVWLNPPYSREAVKWLRRMAEHAHGTALIFARTETSWFFETVWRAATAILFIEGRLHFHRPDGSRAKANAGAPSCLVAYGMDDAETLRNSGIAGHFTTIQSAHLPPNPMMPAAGPSVLRSVKS